MSYVIAITGKGGVGKTTVAGLMVARLIGRGCRPVLAVDADPNTCLDAVLGLCVENTIGRVREEVRTIAGKGMISGISKKQLLELKISESLVESHDFDFVAMGRPEGPGCYCYANNVLKAVLSEISSHYPYVVLDNEAGLENLSRRIVQKVDLLVMVADPSFRGIETVSRLHELAREMEIKYDRLAILVNRLRCEELPAQISGLKSSTGADIIFGLPEDAQLADFAEDGRSLISLPVENAVVSRLDRFLTEIGLPI
jgi:CO dehydrogenase maturation factor